jgi:hypothetical protein
VKWGLETSFHKEVCDDHTGPVLSDNAVFRPLSEISLARSALGSVSFSRRYAQDGGFVSQIKVGLIMAVEFGVAGMLAEILYQHQVIHGVIELGIEHQLLIG